MHRVKISLDGNGCQGSSESSLAAYLQWLILAQDTACCLGKIQDIIHSYYKSLVVRKPVCRVSDHVPHKPGCTATEDGKRLEISDVGSRGIVLSV